MFKLKTRLKKLWLNLGGSITAKCGHTSNLKIHETTWEGHPIKGQFKLTKEGELLLCLDCLLKLAIPCAWCEKPILVGDPITLYEREETYNPPANAVCYDRDHYVGCLRYECARSAMDRAGYWVLNHGEGEVALAPSPLQQLQRMMVDGQTRIIICNLDQVPPEILNQMPRDEDDEE